MCIVTNKFIIHVLIVFLVSHLNGFGQHKTKLQGNAADIDSLYKLSVQHRNDPDSAIFYIQKGIRWSNTIKNQEKEIDGLLLLGSEYLFKGSLDTALQTINSVIENEHASAEQASGANNMLGQILLKQTNPEGATQAHLAALALAEKNKDTLNMLKAYNGLGNINIYIENAQKSLDYYKLAYTLSEAMQLDTYTAPILGNLGRIYRTQGKFEKALEAYNESLQIHPAIGDDFHTAINLQNLGVLYEYREEYEMALNYHKESKALSSKINDQMGMALVFINLGINHGKLNQYDPALKNLDSAVVLCKSIDYREGFVHIYQSYAEIYALMNRYDKAYENNKMFKAYSDSLTNEKHLNAVSGLEIKYETEKKEKEIASLERASLISEATLFKKDRQMRQLTLGILALLIFGTGLFVIFRQRSRNQKQKENITANADTQMKERKRIARDLHDVLGGTLALAKTNFPLYK
ncbi:MAG: tetratricopeptide repeat protein [Leeuwenhoekiella sp.]